MNYIQLINNFWTSNELNSFRTTEISLYFYLLDVCNRLSWKESFKRNNRKIQVDLSISFNTLKDARNRLKQAGLINFETRSGDGNTIYTLSNFDEVTDEVSAEKATSSNFDEVTDEVSTEVGTEVGIEVASTKNKLNKTKLNDEVVVDNNIYNTTPAAPDFSLQTKKIIEFWNERCKNMPPVLELTEPRARDIANLLRVYTPDEICDCLLIASESPTLNGERNERPMKIDWCLRNFVSLYEDRATRPVVHRPKVETFTYSEIYKMTGQFPHPDYCLCAIDGIEVYVRLKDAVSAKLQILRKYDKFFEKQ